MNKPYFNSGKKKYEIGRGSYSLHIEVLQDFKNRYLVSVTYTKPIKNLNGSNGTISVGWMIPQTFAHPHTARLSGHQALFDEITARGFYSEFKELLRGLSLLVNYKNLFNE